MSVHYKFKSAITYDTIAFDGLHISVRDLKKAILHQKQIGKSTDFDLQITNAQSNEVYTDDAALIPKNSSLIVVRIPLTAQQKKAWEKSDANNLHLIGLHKGSSDSPDHILNKFAKSADLTSIDASEEDKIQAAIAQSTLDYDPSNYVRIKGSNQVGEIPSNYRCYKCMQPGHWIKDCKLNAQPDASIEIKKSTGIPRSFMVPVDGPDVPGAMMTPTGQFAVPTIDHQARLEASKKPSEHVTIEKPAIPEDLLCGVCKDLLTDAVMIPCCGNSFCDECIRNVLLESEDHQCPDCKEKDVSPDTLIPNRFLRNSVNNFKNQTGYSRVVPLKPPPAPPLKKQEEPKEPETPISGERPKESEAVIVPGSQSHVIHTKAPTIDTKSDPHLSEPIEVDDDSPNGNNTANEGMPYRAPIPSICSQRTFPFHPHPPHPPHMGGHPNPNQLLSIRPHSNPHPFPQGHPPPPGQVDDQRPHHHHSDNHRHMRDYYKPRNREDRGHDDIGRPRYNAPEPRPLMTQPPPHIHFSQSGGYQVFQPYRPPDFRMRGPRPVARPPPPYARHVPAQPFPPDFSPTDPSAESIDNSSETYEALVTKFVNDIQKRKTTKSRSFSRSLSRSKSPRGRSRTPSLPPRRQRSRNRSHTPKGRTPPKTRSPLPLKGRSPLPLKRLPRGRTRSPRSRMSRTPSRSPVYRTRSRSRSYHSGSRSRSPHSVGRGSPRRRKRIVKSPSKTSTLMPPLRSSPSRLYSKPKEYSKGDGDRLRDAVSHSYKSSSRRSEYSSSSRSNQDYISAQEYARAPDRHGDDYRHSSRSYSKYGKSSDKYISQRNVLDWETIRDREQEQQEREKNQSSYFSGSSSVPLMEKEFSEPYSSNRVVSTIDSSYLESRPHKEHKKDRERRTEKELAEYLFYTRNREQYRNVSYADIKETISREKDKTPEQKIKEKKKKKKDDYEKKRKKRRVREGGSSKNSEDISFEEDQLTKEAILSEAAKLESEREIAKASMLAASKAAKEDSPALDDLYQGLDNDDDMKPIDEVEKEDDEPSSPIQAKPIPVISSVTERTKEHEEKTRDALKEIVPEKDIPKPAAAAVPATAKDVVFAPVPELSKWEKDDETLVPTESKEIYDASVAPNTYSKQVTLEVLKRAENAIFKKVVNLMKTQDKKGVEKVERTDKVEKVEKVERPEKVEKVEKLERPEKPVRRKEDRKEKVLSDVRPREEHHKRSKDIDKVPMDLMAMESYSRDSKYKYSSHPDDVRMKRSSIQRPIAVDKDKPRISAKERLGAKIEDSDSNEIRIDLTDKHMKSRHEKDKERAARIIHRPDSRSHKERKVLTMKKEQPKKIVTDLSENENGSAIHGNQSEDEKMSKSCKKRPLDLSSEELYSEHASKQKYVDKKKGGLSDSDESSDSTKKRKKKKKKAKKKKKKRRDSSSDDSDSSSSSSRISLSDEGTKKSKKKKSDDRRKSQKKSKKRKKSKK